MLDNKDVPVKNDEANEAPVAPEVTTAKAQDSSLRITEATPPNPAAAPEEDTQEIIVVNENTSELDLNHGRIGKIENLEPLQNLERYDYNILHVFTETIKKIIKSWYLELYTCCLSYKIKHLLP